jgi:hypothetical protein
VTDAIPLFHERVMSGTLEIAFDMVESTFHAGNDKDLMIVGLYESNLLIKHDQNASTLALFIAEAIRSKNNVEVLALSLRIPNKQ